MRLLKHSMVHIQRHVKVQGDKSPFDGDWTYWANRTGYYPGISLWLARLIKSQKGKCPVCGLSFLPDDVIEVHITRMATTVTTRSRTGWLYMVTVMTVNMDRAANPTRRVPMTTADYSRSRMRGNLSRPVLKTSRYRRLSCLVHPGPKLQGSPAYPHVPCQRAEEPPSRGCLQLHPEGADAQWR